MKVRIKMFDGYSRSFGDITDVCDCGGRILLYSKSTIVFEIVESLVFDLEVRL